MTTFQTVIISIVEGITEFLPISSTAHMRFTNPLIGLETGPFVDMFEVLIQLAAIMAVVTIYYKKFFTFKNWNLYLKLFIALIPAVIVGFLWKKHIDALLSNMVFMAWVMIAGGVVLVFIDKLFERNKINTDTQVNNKNAFVIGCFQVLSILFPGLSRSAATIIGGLTQKLTRHEAAEFSFLLAVPTMFAASVKEFWDVYKDHHDVLIRSNYMTLGLGIIISYVVALIAIEFFIKFLNKHGFQLFGWYRILAGIAVLILLHMGIMK